MKHLLFLLLTPIAFGAHAQEPATEVTSGGYISYGDLITLDGAISMAEFEKEMTGSDSVVAKVTTEIIESCGKKGCWMQVKMADGSPMMVRFRDYGFFVPKTGLEGKQVVMQGRAKKDVTDVNMLRHYAEDAGKSKEEIEAITEPEISWNFEADGVLVKE